MEFNYLTLEQNLYTARIFLNIFGLTLEEKKEINHYDKLKIFGKENVEVGNIWFKDGVVNISSKTNFGDLTANYNIAKPWGFEDIECGGTFGEWHHDIGFKVNGDLCFDGYMQFVVSLDSDFGNNCRVHSKIQYVDHDNNQIVLTLFDDGKPFRYEINQNDYKEVLEIDPWDDYESYMYHWIRKGKYDSTKHCWFDESIKYVWHNGANDKQHLKTVSNVIEKLKVIENDKKLYDIISENNSVKLTIQKGMLMQQIDSDFSKKIMELMSLFKKDDVSFLENLIDVSFAEVTAEEKEALFGTQIKKINYYNDKDNLLDAYFDRKEANKFSPDLAYQKIIKR